MTMTNLALVTLDNTRPPAQPALLYSLRLRGAIAMGHRGLTIAIDVCVSVAIRDVLCSHHGHHSVEILQSPVALSPAM